MPSAVRPVGTAAIARRSGVVKFTNCLLVKGTELVHEDLWISSVTGKILNGQEILYGHLTAPDHIIDLNGRILSPGLIDVQLNGAYGFDFSIIPEDGPTAYGKGVQQVNRNLIRGGVTSYLPTLTSQRPEVYHKVIHLAPCTTALLSLESFDQLEQDMNLARRSCFTLAHTSLFSIFEVKPQRRQGHGADVLRLCPFLALQDQLETQILARNPLVPIAKVPSCHLRRTAFIIHRSCGFRMTALPL